MIQIVHGDCAVELLELPDGSVRLFLTSPPYNMGKRYEQRLTLEAYLDWLRPIVHEIVRVLSPGGSLAWQVGSWVRDGEVVPLDAVMLPIFWAEGLRCRNRIVWSFGHGLHCVHRFSGRHETVLWMTKGDEYTFDLDAVRVPQKWPQKRYFKGPRKGELSGNPLGCNPGDVWEIGNIKHNHPEKTDHPCQFPEALAERLMLALTKPGDVVVDPFAGSGTVGKAAQTTGRSAILMEKEAAYCEIARQRCGLGGEPFLSLVPLAQSLRILFVDPGNTQSAYAVWDGVSIEAQILPNETMREYLKWESVEADVCAIEMIASYGMSVGKEVFQTCVWIGRFAETIRVAAGKDPQLVFRSAIKLHHCRSNKANDSNIRQALIDKYGAPGTKKAPGLTYGLKADMWAALAGATFLSETLAPS